jgi:hypothetical protein
MPFPTLHATKGPRQKLLQLDAKTISAGITARLVQRTITARAAIRYSVMRSIRVRGEGAAIVSRRGLHRSNVVNDPEIAFRSQTH